MRTLPRTGGAMYLAGTLQGQVRCKAGEQEGTYAHARKAVGERINRFNKQLICSPYTSYTPQMKGCSK